MSVSHISSENTLYLYIHYSYIYIYINLLWLLFIGIPTCIILLCHKWLRNVYIVCDPFYYSLQILFFCIHIMYIYFTSFWNSSIFTFYCITLHYIQRNTIDSFSKPNSKSHRYSRYTRLPSTVGLFIVSNAIQSWSKYNSSFYLNYSGYLMVHVLLENVFLLHYY